MVYRGRLEHSPRDSKGQAIASVCKQGVAHTRAFLLFQRGGHSNGSLTQLERLQRMRKGQPVPPTLNVNLSP